MKATGTIDYQFFVIDTGFTEDKWIQAAEVKPSCRAVVHHVLVFVQPPGEPLVLNPGAFTPGGGPRGGGGGPRGGGQAGGGPGGAGRAGGPGGAVARGGGPRGGGPGGGGPRGGGPRGGNRDGGFISKWLTATVPGARPTLLPEGMAKRVPAGSRLVRSDPLYRNRCPARGSVLDRAGLRRSQDRSQRSRNRHGGESPLRDSAR